MIPPRSQLWPLALACVQSLSAAQNMPAAEAAPLRSVEAVRALSYRESSTGRPVELEGVVTYLRNPSKEHFNFNLIDPSGGIMVYPNQLVPLQPGQHVRVRGTTLNSTHGVRINAHTIEPGALGEVPKPVPLAPEALRLRENQGLYVECEATVRAVRLESNTLTPRRLILEVGTRSERITAWILRFNPETIPFLPGARVKIHGALLHWTNARAQMQSISLMVNATSDVQILAAPSQAEEESLAEVLLWNGPSRAPERVAVRGSVTHHRPQEMVVLQSGTSAIRVRLNHPDSLPSNSLTPGEGSSVLVSGFPVMGEYTVELEDAEVLERSDGPPVLAESYASAEELLRGNGLVDRDGRLVQLPATLLEVRERDGEFVLEMQSGNHFFSAFLSSLPVVHDGLQPGALLRLQGVCNLHLSAERRRLGKAPNQFSLQLAGSHPIEVLQEAPWWSRQRLFAALKALGAMAVGMMIWTVSAARKNKRLREAIAAREAAEARLQAERVRMASDLHDSLEQTLLAASLQMNAATRALEHQRDAAAAPLSLASEFIQRGRQELRETVWDLHAGAGQIEGLSARLLKACNEAGAATATQIVFEGPQQEPRLPASALTQLVRMVRECLTNALKHASAAHITVVLAVDAAHLKVSVTDDGCGFDPTTVPGPQAGHFGLASLRERTQRIRATLTISANSPSGTRIEISLPLQTS